MKFRDYAGKIYRHRYGRWGLHVLFWLFFFGARLYINNISLNPYKVYPKGILLNNLYATLTTAIAYYLLVYVVYKKLYCRKKYIAAIFSFILLLAIYTSLDFLSEVLLMQDKRWVQLVQETTPEYYQYLQRSFPDILLSRVASLGILFQLFVNLALPLLVRMMMVYNRKQLQALELARQNVQLEFNFLKSQVNPHFLHNTLNNIYSLIIHDKKSAAADTVARLSAFMRYSMHDAGVDRASADKEIQLMKDYIELEKIRLNYTQVRSHFETDRTGYLLPPLLLIPLLENAFKYTVDRQGALIETRLLIENGKLVFECSNDYDPHAIAVAKTGIGLNNVKKRLEQYFPGKFSYTASTTNNVYSVNLSVSLL
ncbi:MAG: sensor histidine kinase [Chitinophagaceae bacterium]